MADPEVEFQPYECEDCGKEIEQDEGSSDWQCFGCWRLDDLDEDD